MQPRIYWQGLKDSNTIWGVPSFVIFCHVFLHELRGPAWAVGIYRYLQYLPTSREEFSKMHSTKYHEFGDAPEFTPL